MEEEDIVYINGIPHHRVMGVIKPPQMTSHVPFSEQREILFKYRDRGGRGFTISRKCRDDR